MHLEDYQKLKDCVPPINHTCEDGDPMREFIFHCALLDIRVLLKYVLYAFLYTCLLLFTMKSLYVWILILDIYIISLWFCL